MLNNVISLVDVFIPPLLKNKPQKNQLSAFPYPISVLREKNIRQICHVLIYEKSRCQRQISDCFKKGNDLLQNSSLLLLHWNTNERLEVDQVPHLKCVNHSCYERTFKNTLTTCLLGGHTLRSHRALLIKLKSKINLHLNMQVPAHVHYSRHPLHLFLLLFYSLLSLK